MEVWILFQFEQDDPGQILSVHQSEEGAQRAAELFSDFAKKSLEVIGPFTIEY